MTILLHVLTSLRGSEGYSSLLSNRFERAWQQANPQGRVMRRDLAAEPIPYLDGERFSAFTEAPDARTSFQHDVVRQSDILIDEIRGSDALLFAMPMYNFGVPAQLKSYFDHIARAGVTFRYSEQGPVGLIEDKPVYILCARGGLYRQFDTDLQTPYLTGFLNMLGLKDLHFIYAEGLNIHPQMCQDALAAAEQDMLALLPR